MSPSDEYQQRLRAHERELERLDRRSELIGSVRLWVGVLIIVAAYFALFRTAFSLAWMLAPISAFALLLAYHAKIRRAFECARRASEYYRAGLARIEDRWMGAGRRGDRFANAHHVYALDLDLFGKNSLYELLCVARTRMGEETLARWLLAPASVTAIRDRQAAVRELKTKLDLREQLAILGEQIADEVHPEAISSWATGPSRLQSRAIKWTARGLALAAIVSALIWIFMGLVSPLLAVVAIEASVALYLKKQLRATIGVFERTLPELRQLAGLLARLEREEFNAPLLIRYQEALRSHSLAASIAFAKLQRIVEVIESRRHMFFALLDIPLMITVQAAVAAETWRNAHGAAVNKWLEVVGEFEALLCLATYSDEHPADVFPEFETGPALFHAHAIAHPLLPSNRAVDNDVELDEQKRILLVSGSNMSGKSTLLRTIGINVVLAMMGAPVRARKMRMTELQVGASIRVNDSLAEGSSRFYAEIDRLRLIFQMSRQSRPVLALFDELLQGTNSADRRIGAQGILRALLKQGAIGCVSTHDLALTQIDDADRRVVNVHFQDEIEDGVMKFDYKLHPGVVTKSNAVELMRTMGLDI